MDEQRSLLGGEGWRSYVRLQYSRLVSSPCLDATISIIFFLWKTLSHPHLWQVALNVPIARLQVVHRQKRSWGWDVEQLYTCNE